MLDFLYSIIIHPLYQLVELCYYVGWKVFKNCGYAVLIVSFAVSFFCIPLYNIAEKWQEAERNIQKKLKPGIGRIKVAFKGDEQYMILSTFYKQNHYHPLMALRSSISIAIQIPFFIAAYKFLSNLGDLKGFGFYFIKDMGAPDSSFSIGNFKINILPIAMTVINIISGAIYSKGHPVKEKIQIYGTALVFLILLYNSPSGLVVYWTMNNLFSLVKNIFYKMKHPVLVLYICICALSLGVDWYLLFKHNGYLYRRLMLVSAVSIVFIMPLILKGINYLVKKPFKSLMENNLARTQLFLMTSIALALLAGGTIPSYVISSSPMEFSFIDNYKSPFFFLSHSLWQAIGFCVFWPCCIYFLFEKEKQTIMTVLGTLICLGAFVNAFIFGGKYGNISNILTFSNAGLLKPDKASVLINFAVLLIPTVFTIILFIFKKESCITALAAILIIANAGILFVHGLTIRKGYNQAKVILESQDKLSAGSPGLTPIFRLSKAEKNVFIIMLDRAINGYVPYIFEENKELYEQYDGFTLYPNTVSYGPYTITGSPAMYGGYDYTPYEINKRSDESLVSKQNEALTVLPLIFDQNGYDTTVTDMSWANYSVIPDLRIYDKYPTIHVHPTIRVYTDAWLKQHPEASSENIRSGLLKRNFIWFSFFKAMPLFFRDTIYNNGFWWNTNPYLHNFQDIINNYAPLDFLPELTKTDAEKPSFTYLVNEMSHEPYFLQAPEYKPLANITNKGNGPFSDEMFYHVNAASIKRLGEFFAYLKKNGVYDNTRIIITADHGESLDTKISPNQDEANLPFRIEAYNPLFLFKDFDSHGELKIDNSFMTNADTPDLSVKGLIDYAVNPFTGNPIHQPTQKQKIFLIDSDGDVPASHHTNTFKCEDSDWYAVKENIFEPSNWTHESPYKSKEEN